MLDQEGYKQLRIKLRTEEFNEVSYYHVTGVVIGQSVKRLAAGRTVGSSRLERNRWKKQVFHTRPDPPRVPPSR